MVASAEDFSLPPKGGLVAELLRVWPLVVILVGVVAYGVRLEMGLESLAELPARVERLESYSAAHEATHTANKRVYEVTLPKVERDLTQVKAQLAAVRESLDLLRQDIRDRGRR